MTFHLLHAVVCAASGTCSCVVVATNVARTDQMTRARVVDRRDTRIPSSVTIWPRGIPGSRGGPFHPSVLGLPDVAARIKARALVVESLPGPPAVAVEEPHHDARPEVAPELGAGSPADAHAAPPDPADGSLTTKDD